MEEKLSPGRRHVLRDAPGLEARASERCGKLDAALAAETDKTFRRTDRAGRLLERDLADAGDVEHRGGERTTEVVEEG
jgi:hypothetical protein